MFASLKRSRARAIAASAAFSLVATPLALVATPAHAADPVEIQVLATNDFHGRLLPNRDEAGAAVLSGAVKQLRAENPNTVFTAAGDLIGASTFESFIAQDKPTIDALNEAGLEVSAAGNHEFDKGYDDLVNRVMAPYDADTNPYGGANWEYLAANVKKASDGSDALDPSWVKDFGGVEVGFIGAVTEHLDSLVNPEGIADIEVTDIVEEVNAEADALVADGVDVVVLLVHEGASTTSIESATDPSSDFGAIVNGVDADVDAIVSGHTHLAYNHTIDGRPVVSAGQYGTNLNQLNFSVDPDTGEVLGVEQNVLALAGNYEPDPATETIVQDAVDEAEELGSVPLGKIAAPFNRAQINGLDEDGNPALVENRGGESTLGNQVAEVQRQVTDAQLALMNPGGLREDMVGTGTYPSQLTYREAADVQPFANTLVKMQLTGAQIKTALEQQWQPDGASRPFLRLGTSEGFEYTYDPNAAKGERVTQMWLDGEPIDLAASYTVTANSFLAAGGDNFGVLAEGSNPQDTGITDLQGMVDFMEAYAETPLAPDYAQRSVGVSFAADAPGSYLAGATVEFELSSLDMTTEADTRDDEVQVSLGEQALGSFPVDHALGDQISDEYGTASVSVELPEDLAVGEHVLTVTGATTGTEVEVPVKVGKSSEITAKATDLVYGEAGGVKVTVTSDSEATGTIRLYEGDTFLGKSRLRDGEGAVRIPRRSLKPGKHTLTVVYLGDGEHAEVRQDLVVRVAKGDPRVRVKDRPKRVVAKKTRARVIVKVTAPGQHPVKGRIKVRIGGKTYQAKLDGGRAVVKLKKFAKARTYKGKVTYRSTKLNKRETKTFKIKVRKKK